MESPILAPKLQYATLDGHAYEADARHSQAEPDRRLMCMLISITAASVYVPRSSARKLDDDSMQSRTGSVKPDVCRYELLRARISTSQMVRRHSAVAVFSLGADLAGQRMITYWPPWL